MPELLEVGPRRCPHPQLSSSTCVGRREPGATPVRNVLGNQGGLGARTQTCALVEHLPGKGVELSQGEGHARDLSGSFSSERGIIRSLFGKGLLPFEHAQPRRPPTLSLVLGLN